MLARGLAAALALAAIAVTPCAAEGDRTLVLHSVNTGEDLTVTFKRDGRYVPEGLALLRKFTRDRRANATREMDPRLFDAVWEVWKESGSRMPVHMVCGFRTVATNAMLRRTSSGVSKHSQHSEGKAMDFFLPDVSAAKLRTVGLRLQEGGVGYYPASRIPFVHIDVGGIRHWPKMTRPQLAKVFPTGETVHIPSDGKPMARYEQALAAISARSSGKAPIMLADAAPAIAAAPPAKRPSLLAMIFGPKDVPAAAVAVAAAAPPAPSPAPAAPVPALVSGAPAELVAAVPMPTPAPGMRFEPVKVAEAVVPLPPVRPAEMVVRATSRDESPVSLAAAIIPFPPVRPGPDRVGEAWSNFALAYAPAEAKPFNILATPGLVRSSGAETGLAGGQEWSFDPKPAEDWDGYAMARPDAYAAEANLMSPRAGTTQRLTTPSDALSRAVASLRSGLGGLRKVARF